VLAAERGQTCKGSIQQLSAAAATAVLLRLVCVCAGVIGASEIGDKTFFIAAVMAMRNSRWTVRMQLHGGAGRPGPWLDSLLLPRNSCAGVCWSPGCPGCYDCPVSTAGLGSTQPGASLVQK
jgi:hypothetical protein